MFLSECFNYTQSSRCCRSLHPLSRADGGPASWSMSGRSFPFIFFSFCLQVFVLSIVTFLNTSMPFVSSTKTQFVMCFHGYYCLLHYYHLHLPPPCLYIFTLHLGFKQWWLHCSTSVRWPRAALTFSATTGSP